MKTEILKSAISQTTYPGRGIVLGKSPNGKFAVAAYFIMGRSENSRNRIFVEDGDGIRTQAFAASKMTDPSLIIYSPVRVWGNRTIVTNGDQTDTIYEGFANDLTFEQALRAREFENDAPNFTPRISGVMNIHDGIFNYALSILKSDGGDPQSCQRFEFSYTNPSQGKGHFLHTYLGDGNPLPSFEGEPVSVEIATDKIDELTDSIWNALNAENKISLFTRFIEIASGKFESRIVNKNK